MSKNVRTKQLETSISLFRNIKLDLELKKTSKVIVTAVKNFTSCDSCLLIKLNNIQNRLIASTSSFIRQKEIDLEKSLLSKIIKGKSRYKMKGKKKGFPLAFLPPSFKSILFYPIVINHKVKYILCLASKNDNSLGKKQEDFSKTFLQDITILLERNKQYAKLKKLSIKDPLTRCFNRRKFDEDIEFEIARAKRYKRPLSLVILDIDHFKQYNDFHGHQRGDKLLRKLAQVLQDNIRDIDKIYHLYRYGGEEFSILLPETDNVGAKEIAKRLLKLINDTSFEEERQSQPEGKITISIGIANLSHCTQNKKQLIKSADMALYKAKELGRNTFATSKEGQKFKNSTT